MSQQGQAQTDGRDQPASICPEDTYPKERAPAVLRGAQGIPGLELPKHHPNMRLGAWVPFGAKEKPRLLPGGSRAERM